jgi:hypothetical protein
LFRVQTWHHLLRISRSFAFKKNQHKCGWRAGMDGKVQSPLTLQPRIFLKGKQASSYVKDNSTLASFSFCFKLAKCLSNKHVPYSSSLSYDLKTYLLNSCTIRDGNDHKQTGLWSSKATR